MNRRHAGKAGLLALVTTLVSLCSMMPASGKDATFSQAEKTAIEKIIRDYIMENPEILPEAMEVLQNRMTAEMLERNKEAIYQDKDTIVGGNPKGDVTIVEFFDYTCGYCKIMSPMLAKLLAEDGNIRMIYKEWPVRGPVSDFASKAALAARGQGKYEDFHHALFNAKGQLSEDRVLDIAEEIGINTDRLKDAMKAPATGAIIDRNHELGQKLGLRGTPAFIIGDTLIPGAVSEAEIKQAIAKAREANKKN